LTPSTTLASGRSRSIGTVDASRKAQGPQPPPRQHAADLEEQDDAELEEAIRLSLRMPGDPNEEEMERAIAENLNEMKRQDEGRERTRHGVVEASVVGGPSAASQAAAAGVPAAAHAGADEHDVDEDDEHLKAALEASARESAAPPDDEEELRLALEASAREHVSAPAASEDELRRALEESRRSGDEEADRARREEAIVLEFVRKQSLAEAEFGKGKKAEAEEG
jgi:hypothetical protein